MVAYTVVVESMPAPSDPRHILVRLLRTALGTAAYAALAFVGAGRVDWMRGFVYAAVFVSVSVVGAAIVQRANPGLLEARAKGIRPDTKSFDRAFYVLFVPLILIYPLLAGMDAARFSWLPLPWWTVYPGAALFVLGSSFGTWAMMENPHADSTVRIGGEESHKVVTTGPYRVVRHPLYLGTLIGLPGTALMLGSAWAAAPMLVIAMLFVWRTAREDGALRSELAGYEAYAGTTPWRLLPGVW
jgi:protein-S-isoprenylcysteine O-methyltransferase Ste14